MDVLNDLELVNTNDLTKDFKEDILARLNGWPDSQIMVVTLSSMDKIEAEEEKWAKTDLSDYRIYKLSHRSEFGKLLSKAFGRNFGKPDNDSDPYSDSKLKTHDQTNLECLLNNKLEKINGISAFDLKDSYLVIKKDHTVEEFLITLLTDALKEQNQRLDNIGNILKNNCFTH